MWLVMFMSGGYGSGLQGDSDDGRERVKDIRERERDRANGGGNGGANRGGNGAASGVSRGVKSPMSMGTPSRR